MRIGMIGSSAGNGHPFSWSAIINGFDPSKKDLCDFPVIVSYLENQNWPADQISEASVECVWTQDKELSMRIASFASIPNVCQSYRDFLGKVDAVIVARDDAENHLEFAHFFVSHGIPVFLDKPIATNVKMLDAIFEIHNAKKFIFSSTSVLYSREIEIRRRNIINDIETGSLKKIIARTPNSWDRYGIHILEPTVSFFNTRTVSPKDIIRSSSACGEDVYFHMDGVGVHLRSTGASAGKISFKLIHIDHEEQFEISDVFYSFKKILLDFLHFCKTGSRSVSTDYDAVVRLLDKGV